METRLLGYVVAVVALLIPSLAAMADQSDKLVGVHEIPRFVLERVELPWGRSGDQPQRGESPGSRRADHAAPSGGAQHGHGPTGSIPDEFLLKPRDESPSPGQL